ncbi:MAG: DDE-type integrase/transposase/recombinase [Vicinamibacteria bacterium]|nr:DDE-type integrase/transposase/recombinase [Vicinamibacteria bacterium]
MTAPSPPLDLRMGRLDEKATRLALRAVLSACHLLGLAAGVHLRSLRAMKDPLADLQARLELAELRAQLAWEALDILAARFDKIPERRRPYFAPTDRFRTLEMKNLLSWSADKTAKVFLVCQNTILNWERQADPEAKTVGSSVKTTPPIRRVADAAIRLAQTMAALGFGGDGLVARTIARAGWKVSATAVARYRKHKPLPPASPNPIKPEPTTPTRPVTARFVHHTWMMDVSQVRQILGGTFYMATVFDAFSRCPLVLEVFGRKPSGKDMAELLRRAAKAFANPRYVITDLGGEFRARVFATAWRTLKETARLRGLLLPLTAEDLEQRLQAALVFYLCFRPHEGLAGATPAEAFLALEPAHKSAVKPPRGLPGQAPTEHPFAIDYLDPASRSFPILKRAA